MAEPWGIGVAVSRRGGGIGAAAAASNVGAPLGFLDGRKNLNLAVTGIFTEPKGTGLIAFGYQVSHPAS